MSTAIQATWEDIISHAETALSERKLDGMYEERLRFEIQEVEKQGANLRWIDYFNDGKKFDSNPNQLVLPWLLGMVESDPIANRSEPMLNTVKAFRIKEFKTEHGSIPSDLIKDADMPDIDLDCLPEARDPIKEFAAKKYGMNIDDGYGPVCSVGTWQTYKFKNAIIDACSGTGFVDKYEAYELTTNLPDDVDQLKDGAKSVCKGRVTDHKTGKDSECGTVHALAKCPDCDSPDTEGPTLGKLLAEHEQLNAFAKRHKDVIQYAVRLIGRVRNMGMHAGALIIADRTLYGNIPMAKVSADGPWRTMWSEGRNTQLSKFGYIKWDILGLKTLKYIFECCKLIEQNRGISFGERKNPNPDLNRQSQVLIGEAAPPAMSGWDDIDPTKSRAGHFFDTNGDKHYIDLNDPNALQLANDQKTDGVFQFDTDLAKSILTNGVRNFEDLMLFNAMGHPGPMASIPDAVKNRDDKRGTWKKLLYPAILEILKDTYGVIVYQEQLQAIWQAMAGFTAPEAQEARKAVAKKWAHKLKPIREKWLAGASRTMTPEEADEWWAKMETFGRYAFNRSHAVSYCLVAHRCLWLKAHFAPEWWAAVMSDCNSKKLVRYMGIARSEKWEPTEITNSGNSVSTIETRGVRFGTLNLLNMTKRFTVTENVVNQGLIGIKGIGDAAADKYEGRGEYTDIDDFIEQMGGKDKSSIERFIKLGSFQSMPGHENARATWMWYQYKYCSGKDITKMRKEIKTQLLEREDWNEQTIKEERERMIAEYRRQYPNRRKIPDKFNNWNPKPNDRRERVMALFEDDFPLADVLEFEKLYLGYYLHSPLELFVCSGGGTIEEAKAAGRIGDECKLEVVIVDIDFGLTKTKNEFARIVVSDGIQQSLVMMWSNEMAIQDANNLMVDTGVQMYVDYDEQRNSFSLCRGEIIIRLTQRKKFDGES